MHTQQSVIEYVGEMLPDGHLSTPLDVLDQIEPGQKLKIRVEICGAASGNTATILKKAKNSSDDIVAAELDSMDFNSDMHRVVDQDWSDWLSPDEDIYEEYRQYAG